jgi:hypothetical protein
MNLLERFTSWWRPSLSPNGHNGTSTAVAEYAESKNLPRHLKNTVSTAGSFFGYYGPLSKSNRFRPTPFNPDQLVQRKGLKIYRTMAQDEQIKAALAAKQYAVLSTGYDILLPELPDEDSQEMTDASEEQKEFLEFNFNEMVGGIESKLLGIMDALTYGFSVSEKLFEKVEYGPHEGKWMLKDLRTRPPEDIEFQTNEVGDLDPKGVLQFGVELPAEKFVIYSYRSQYGNLYGDSDLRAAYRAWWCYSADTEVLTRAGWKLFSQVTPADELATLNQATEHLEYQLPEELFCFPYRGQMFHQDGRFIDLLVTPDHRMYAKGVNQREFHLTMAKDLPRHVSYKRNAVWVGEERNSFTLPMFEHVYPVSNGYGHHLSERRYYQDGRAIVMDDWLQLLGIFLAEGCTVKTKRGQRYVVISQNRGPKLELIKQWITACGFHFGEHKKENDKCVDLLITNAQLYEYLKPLGKSRDKYIPQEFKDLCPRQLKILFDAMMLGDGKHGFEYCTVSRRLADDVSELILKMGYAATVKVDSGVNRFGKFSIYLISKNTRNVGNTRCNEHKDQRELVDYDGQVYCAKVPNSLLYVRRNGKACWSGNCKDNMLKLMAVSLERYAEPIADVSYEGMLSEDQRLDIEAFLLNLQSRSGLLHPANVTLQFLAPPPRAAEAFIPAINLYDQHMRIAVLMPGLIGLSGEQSTGSFARAVKEFDVFLWILGQLRKDLETVINEQIIKPLIDFNFTVEHGQYPKFKFNEVTEDARHVQFELFLAGLAGGGLQLGPEDQNKLRELINFEPLPEDFEQIDPTTGYPPGEQPTPEEQMKQQAELGMMGGFGQPAGGGFGGEEDVSSGWEEEPDEDAIGDEEEYEFSDEKALLRYVQKTRDAKAYHQPGGHDQDRHAGADEAGRKKAGEQTMALKHILKPAWSEASWKHMPGYTDRMKRDIDRYLAQPEGLSATEIARLKEIKAKLVSSGSEVAVDKAIAPPPKPPTTTKIPSNKGGPQDIEDINSPDAPKGVLDIVDVLRQRGITPISRKWDDREHVGVKLPHDTAFYHSSKRQQKILKPTVTEFVGDKTKVLNLDSANNAWGKYVHRVIVPAGTEVFQGMDGGNHIRVLTPLKVHSVKVFPSEWDVVKGWRD